MQTSKYTLKKYSGYTLTIFLLLFYVGFHPMNAFGSQIKHGLSKVDKRWKQAVESGDLNTISQMYAPTATVYPLADMMVVNGKKAILARYANMFKNFHVKVETKNAHYIEQSHLVYSWGLFTMLLTSKANGQRKTVHGRFSGIASNVQGQWQYIFDHASVPMSLCK